MQIVPKRLEMKLTYPNRIEYVEGVQQDSSPKEVKDSGDLPKVIMDDDAIFR